MDKRSIQNKKSKTGSIETFIVILIAGCMIFLINFTNSKLDQFSRLKEEVVLINHEFDNEIYEEFAKEIVAYRPDNYKMIEVYNEDLKHIMTLQFMNNPPPSISDLSKYPELISLFKNNKEGYTDIIFENEGIKQDIYFKWLQSSSTGNKYLIITYSLYHPVENLWIFNLTAYIVVLLVFILFIRLRIMSYSESIKQYDSLSKRIRRNINDK